MAVLLSLMIGSSAEDVQLCAMNYGHGEKVKLTSDVLLDNVRSVIQQLKVGKLKVFKQMLHVSASETGTYSY